MPLDREIAVLREAEFEVRREPAGVEGEAGLLHLLDDVAEILLDEVRQHEAVVQLGAPARQALRCVRLLPEAGDQRTQQQLLGERHARVRRHLEGAQFEQAEAPGRAVRRIELVDAELGAVRVAGDVDEQVPEHAVDQPGRDVAADRRNLAEGDLHLVERIVPRLVDARRLAGRADEQAGEQVGQAGVVVPVGDQAAQQVRPAQEGRVVRRRAAEHEVVAAAGAGVAAVDHELLGGQARETGRLVEVRGLLDQLVPALGRMDVDLDHAGVGRHAEIASGAGRPAARSLRG